MFLKALNIDRTNLDVDFDKFWSTVALSVKAEFIQVLLFSYKHLNNLRLTEATQISTKENQMKHIVFKSKSLNFKRTSN